VRITSPLPNARAKATSRAVALYFSPVSFGRSARKEHQKSATTRTSGRTCTVYPDVSRATTIDWGPVSRCCKGVEKN